MKKTVKLATMCHRSRFLLCSVAWLTLLLSSCGGVPPSVKLYAADLPARADGQYAMIDDDDIKKSLITKDALLQCSIDTHEKLGEDTPACKCAKTASSDWFDDCSEWLGPHTPEPTTSDSETTETGELSSEDTTTEGTTTEETPSET